MNDPITVHHVKDLGPLDYRESATGMEGRQVTLIAREGKYVFLLFDRSVLRAALDCITQGNTIRFSVCIGEWTDGEAPAMAAPVDLEPIVGQTLHAVKFFSSRMQIEFDRHRLIIADDGAAYCFPHTFSQGTVH